MDCLGNFATGGICIGTVPTSYGMKLDSQGIVIALTGCMNGDVFLVDGPNSL